MVPDIASLCEVVRTSVRSELLPQLSAQIHQIKSDGSVVTDTDHALQKKFRIELKRHWPEFAFLGEEMSPLTQKQLLNDTRTGLWVLDPLDGTTNYAAGLPYFATSLALVVNGRPILGVVYDPMRDECFSAQHEQGAWLNGSPLMLKNQNIPEFPRTVAAVDFKRLPPKLATALATRAPYGSQRNFGAASLEWCWLAAARFHLYLHGSQRLWDYAAGSLILREAGGAAKTLDDEEVFTLNLVPRSVVAAIDPTLLGTWSAWIDNQRGTK